MNLITTLAARLSRPEPVTLTIHAKKIQPGDRIDGVQVTSVFVGWDCVIAFDRFGRSEYRPWQKVEVERRT